MKSTVICSSIAAVLTLAGVCAHASCTDPRMAGPSAKDLPPIELHTPSYESHHDGEGHGRESAAERIVGTWHVVYTSGGQPFAQAFMQWHSDHTEWEHITQPVLGGNICMGSWKVVDGTHVFRNHYGWLFTEGTISGYFNETETNEVAKDGNSYHGVNETKIYDMSGNLLATVPGTSSAKRIAP